jgi:hypothetical protein
VVGKTGTLPATDGGVSTGGIIYQNSRTDHLCNLQYARFRRHVPAASDNLLKELIVESAERRPALECADPPTDGAFWGLTSVEHR